MDDKTKKLMTKLFWQNMFWVGVSSAVAYGYFAWAGSPIYDRGLLLLHWIYWPAGIFTFFVAIAVKAMVAKLGTSAMAINTNSIETSLEAMSRLHVYYGSWVRKIFRRYWDPAMLVFIFMFMGDYSFFTAYLVSWTGGLAMFSTFNGFYEKLKAESEETESEAVKVAEAAAEQAKLNPLEAVTTAVREKKTADAETEAESEDNIIDTALEELGSKDG